MKYMGGGGGRMEKKNKIFREISLTIK